MVGLLLATSAFGLGACGSSEDPLTANQASKQIVIDVSDLPPGSERSSKRLLAERCSPASHFRKYAQSVVSPPGFKLPNDKLLQQVGIFRKPSEAEKALRQVLSTKARRCVEGQMQATSLSLAGSKGTITFKRLPGLALDGVTSGAGRLHFTHALGMVQVQQMMMVDGRSLTTLTFISENHTLSPDLWHAVVDKTAASLRHASSGLEG